MLHDLLDRLNALGGIEIQSTWLVDEEPQRFRTEVLGRFNFQGVDFQGLIEGKGNYQLQMLKLLLE